MGNNGSGTKFIAELRRRRPFDRIAEEHLVWLSDRMEEIVISDGTPILTPGGMSDSLYFISSGIVQLEAVASTADNLKILAELVDGESFPLEALEENRPVFSTFRSKGDTICYVLKKKDFEQFKNMSTVFSEFCKYRSQSFLEQSRRVYRLHFSHQSDDQQRLSQPLMLLMRPNPTVAHFGDSVRTVVALMYEHNEDAAIIIDKDRKPLGIFTMRDLLRKVVVSGGDLNAPIEQVMTPSPETLPVSALGYEAALLLAKDGFHHLILEENGKLAGIVTERDLFNLQRVSLSQITNQINTADTIEWLKECHRDVHLLAENMLVQGVTADQITQIISSLNDQIVCRVLEIEKKGVEIDDINICWVAFGSEGRFEQTLTTDQDNGIIFEAPEGTTSDQVRERLLPYAQRVNKSLDEVGFPLCKGNIMASNPECCLSFSEWQKRFQRWISVPTPEALLNASIFFDFRPFAGNPELSDRLRTWLADICIGQNRFFHMLVQNALERTPPVGLFRDFVVEEHEDCPNSLDLKNSCITLFVDAARVYALANGVTRSNTKQRLIAAGDIKKWPQSEVNAWADSFSFLQSLRIRQQYELKLNCGKLHNRINPYDLNNLDRKFFLEALRQAGKLQKHLSGDFGMRMM
ncbi:MAG: CBS domain-containing protein [Nitrospirae bacterium]|nr:CBS domain-containing protein [Nitrospirota bacterium]